MEFPLNGMYMFLYFHLFLYISYSIDVCYSWHLKKFKHSCHCTTGRDIISVPLIACIHTPILTCSLCPITTSSVRLQIFDTNLLGHNRVSCSYWIVSLDSCFASANGKCHYSRQQKDKIFTVIIKVMVLWTRWLSDWNIPTLTWTRNPANYGWS